MIVTEPSPPTGEAWLVPARMLNEMSYCPRLFALEWVHGEWEDSADTIDGRMVHRRVDQPSRSGLPAPDAAPADDGRPSVIRSVLLSDARLGMIARIDLTEVDGDRAIPIDYKRGRAPEIPEGAWEPERVQVCAQALLLRAHGYRCDEGALWFAESRRRVRVEIDETLVARTLALREQAVAIASTRALPPPLVGSRKCDGCSLVGICLPDEVNLLTGRDVDVRPLVAARDDALPLYVRLQGGSVGRDHDEIVVKDKGTEVGRARIADTSRVVILGNASITTPLLHTLAEADVPVAVHSSGGWFRGAFVSASGHNVQSRIAQHRTAGDADASIHIARAFIHAKICNQRVYLRRNADGVSNESLGQMRDLAERAQRAPDSATLMGIEGAAARLYFQAFPLMIKGPLRDRFRFEGRNRRPPKDPVNAMLSFAYASLVREYTIVAHQVGLDPHVGFLHQPRPGRPALALDLMEEMRPVVADSVVINAINNEVVTPDDFLEHPTGVALRDGARRRFITVFERRMDELATHPTFGTRLSYRRILEVQARLLCRTLLGELPTYPEYRVR
jgi:CRISPR-associated protein Cas1